MKRFKGVVKKILMGFCAWLPFGLLRRMAGSKVLIINYHSIDGWDPDVIINRKKYRTLEQFEADLKFFIEKYEPIGLNEFIANTKSGRIIGMNSLLLTIDDGLSVVYQKMFPLLKAYKVSASVFLNPCFVDNEDMHYLRKRNVLLEAIDFRKEKEIEMTPWFTKEFQGRGIKDVLNSIAYKDKDLLDRLAELCGISFQDYLRKHKLYLSKEEIKEMRDEGFSFGGHGMDHAPLSELELPEVVKQIRGSVDWVARSLVLNYRAFAFPSNDKSIGQETFDKLDGSLDLSFGVQGLREDSVTNHFHRIEIEATGFTAQTAIKYEYAKLIALHLLGKKVLNRN